MNFFRVFKVNTCACMHQLGDLCSQRHGVETDIPSADDGVPRAVQHCGVLSDWRGEDILRKS